MNEKIEKFLSAHKEYTKAKLGRQALAKFIDDFGKEPDEGRLKTFIKDVRGILTPLKAYADLLLNEEKVKDVPEGIQQKIQKIADKTRDLEALVNEQAGANVVVSQENYDVLVVDDDEDTIEVLESVFEIKDIKVHSLTNGRFVLEEVRRNNPKVILLDIMLPDVSGDEICSAIKNDPELKDSVVYFISAIDPTDSIRLVQECKADGVFPKPFNMELLERSILAHVKG